MKSYRERYFEDYVAVPDEKRPGKVKYRYVGAFVEPFVEKGSLGAYRAAMAAAELLSLLLWGVAVTRDVSFNHIRMAGGFGILALVPWAMELWNVLRYVLAGNRIKELDYETMTKYIEAGALLHCLIMVLATGSGVMAVFGAGDRIQSLLVAAGHLTSGLISLLVRRLYKKIYYHTYTGKGGQNEII